MLIKLNKQYVVKTLSRSAGLAVLPGIVLFATFFCLNCYNCSFV